VILQLPDVSSAVTSQMNTMLSWSVFTQYLSIVIGTALFATIGGMVLWLLSRK